MAKIIAAAILFGAICVICFSQDSQPKSGTGMTLSWSPLVEFG